MTRASEAQERTITVATPIALGTVVTLVSTILGGALYVQAALSSLEHRIELLAVRLDSRIESLESRVSDRWTATDMRRWVRELKTVNPGLKLPPVEDER